MQEHDDDTQDWNDATNGQQENDERQRWEEAQRILAADPGYFDWLASLNQYEPRRTYGH
jgi:hypothetical protein